LSFDSKLNRSIGYSAITDGEYKMEVPEFPQFICTLFDGSHVKSNNFFQHIRSYNSSFLFASFNVNLINFQDRQPGPYCFKIQGQIYYQINTAYCVCCAK
jgi:hypothetical protein